MEKLEIEDLTDYTFLSNPNFSPDGKHVCFSDHEIDERENEYISTLWILVTETEEIYKLTNSGKDSYFIWLNNEEILFTSKRKMGVEEEKKDDEEEEKKTRFFKINIHGGEAEHLFTVDQQVGSLKKSDDGIFAMAWDDVEKNKNDQDDENDDKELEEGKDYHELDEIPFWSNEKDFSNKKRMHLYELDVKEKKIEQIVGGYKNVSDFDVQDNKLCLVINEYEDMMEVKNYLYEFDLNNGKFRRLTEEELRIDRARYINDNILFEATDMERMGINTNREFYVYKREDDEYEKLTDKDRSLGNSLLTDVRYGGGEIVRVEDENYYFLLTEGYNVGLYRFNLEDGIEPIVEKEGSIDSFDVHNGKFIYVGLRDQHPQELYLYDDEEKRLTDFNEMEFKISEPEYFKVECDGREIDAWVMKPVDFEENQKYPTILEIHGCPKCVYGTVHFHQMQIMVNDGYAVVFSNPSGSSGKGDEFADITGEYGQRDYEDIMKVMDEALERYDFIDEDRLGVTGGSYGGFMTNWVIGHTDRFEAAVSFRSISNWISKFATTDIGYYFVEDQIQGDPWNDLEKLWDHSPLKYADQVDTPTLFITSRKDYRCWEAEAIQMFTALKYHGVDSKLVLFEKENHNLAREGKPKQRIKRLEEMMNWFNKYLK